jgi:sugar/nucleoside kinase (ribokinase family)
MGAKTLIVKKGEHGAMLFARDHVFCTPAFLLESIYDPTGAGDTFAGGLIGYMAGKNAVDLPSLRQAIVYGSIMATFTVEDFSVGRLAAVTKKDIQSRFRQFQKLTCF